MISSANDIICNSITSTMITPNQLTTNLMNIRQSKILFIETDIELNAFITNYAINNDTNQIIDWTRVANDFKGIGISIDVNKIHNLNHLEKNYGNWIKEIGFNRFIEFPKDLKVETDSEAESKIETTDKADSESDSESNENPNTIRYFKMIDPVTGQASGRFTGYTAKQAASKIFTKMLQKCKIDNNQLHPNLLFICENPHKDLLEKYFIMKLLE